MALGIWSYVGGFNRRVERFSQVPNEPFQQQAGQEQSRGNSEQNLAIS